MGSDGKFSEVVPGPRARAQQLLAHMPFFFTSLNVWYSYSLA